MNSRIEEIRQAIREFSESGSQAADLFRQNFTGKNGSVSKLFDDFRTLPKEEKAVLGKLLNELKNEAAAKLEVLSSSAGLAEKTNRNEDLGLPGDSSFTGSRHPISIVLNRVIGIFNRIGFTIADGPEIEDVWHNFDALNMPESHPARDMQDTFFVQMDPGFVLRTHTSNVQIRVMEKQQPPIRILAPGRVYRNETISARAHCFFHQVEGLNIDTGVSFADLKQVMLTFSREMFGSDTKIRLRPSYFPFTEISAEMDVTCMICGGSGCPVCKGSGWVEILGCGMVDPDVLQNCGIDQNKYSGYAFGMGIERIAMLNYGINDLRVFSTNDSRFLSQFSGINS